jgi:hypothetical protein
MRVRLSRKIAPAVRQYALRSGRNDANAVSHLVETALATTPAPTVPDTISKIDNFLDNLGVILTGLEKALADPGLDAELRAFLARAHRVSHDVAIGVGDARAKLPEKYEPRA